MHMYGIFSFLLIYNYFLGTTNLRTTGDDASQPRITQATVRRRRWLDAE